MNPIKTFGTLRRPKKNLAFFLVLAGLVSVLWADSETVDLIAAVVNEDVITLSDLKIVEALGLFEGNTLKLEEIYTEILEELVNRKLVIGLTQNEVPVMESDIEAVLKTKKRNMGDQGLEAVLIRFGLDEQDIDEYIREKLLFEKIIEERFGLAIVVRLADIESYYRNTYVPNQEARGLEPSPMIDMLSEIETAIRNNKVDTQVEEWISGLKSDADIRILIQRRVEK